MTFVLILILLFIFGDYNSILKKLILYFFR